MFDLRNKNIYVGNQEILRGYLGSNLLYDSVGLVLPKPPTEYRTDLLSHAYFFGSGRILTYHGNGVADELSGHTVKRNGLFLEDDLNLLNIMETETESYQLDMTIERPTDILNSLSPGESKVIASFQAYDNNTIIYIGKDAQGIEKMDSKNITGMVRPVEVTSSNLRDAPNMPDSEFFHLSAYIMGSPYASRRANYTTFILINGVEYINRSNYSPYNATTPVISEISNGLLLYDLKLYEGRTSYKTTATTNYNGIKDLPFVLTSEL